MCAFTSVYVVVSLHRWVRCGGEFPCFVYVTAVCSKVKDPPHAAYVLSDFEDASDVSLQAFGYPQFYVHKQPEETKTASQNCRKTKPLEQSVF